MIRHHRPQRFVEVGSGFSSLVTARVNREHFDGSIDFVCVEPYPRQFLVDGVPGISGLRVEKVQDTPLEVFTSLQAATSCSRHVARRQDGGDVPWIYHEILPRLTAGVVVHMHESACRRLPTFVGARRLGLERDVPRARVPHVQRGFAVRFSSARWSSATATR